MDLWRKFHLMITHLDLHGTFQIFAWPIRKKRKFVSFLMLQLVLEVLVSMISYFKAQICAMISVEFNSDLENDQLLLVLILYLCSPILKCLKTKVIFRDSSALRRTIVPTAWCIFVPPLVSLDVQVVRLLPILQWNFLHPWICLTTSKDKGLSSWILLCRWWSNFNEHFGRGHRYLTERQKILSNFNIRLHKIASNDPDVLKAFLSSELASEISMLPSEASAI